MGKSDRIQRKHENEAVKREQKRQEEEIARSRSRLIKRITIPIVSVFALFLIVWSVLTGSGLIQRSMTAMTVDGIKISVAEFNYYYMNSVMDFQQTYSAETIASFGLSFSQPLSAQMLDEEHTWQDYFEEEAIGSVKNIVMLSERAKAEGIELTEDDHLAVTAFINGISESAGDQKIDRLLPSVFGKGTTVANLTTTRERYQLAQRYVRHLQETVSVSPEEIEAEYAANKSSYDVSDFWAFNLNFAGEGLEGDALEARKAEVETTAQDVVERIQNGESFADLALEFAPEDQKELFEDKDATLTAGVKKSVAGNISADFSEWLFDPVRSEGDVSYFTTANAFVVAEFGKVYRDETPTRDVHHILITPQADANGVVTDQVYIESSELAADLLVQFAEAGSTPEAFGHLAAEYSDDTASSAFGGFYANVQRGEMTIEFEEWLFDPERKPGDTGVTRTNYGYHAMFYTGEGLPSWEAYVKNAVIDSKLGGDYEAWFNAIEVKQNKLGMSLTKA